MVGQPQPFGHQGKFYVLNRIALNHLVETKFVRQLRPVGHATEFKKMLFFFEV